MSYLGDIRLGDTIDFKFCTTAASTGAPTTLAGTPVISAYPGNSTTQITAGITLTADFDSVTGLNNVRIVATVANGYAANTNYELVITTGTVGGTSAVGYCIGTFSIDARGIVKPAAFGTAAAIANGTITLASGHGITSTSVLVRLTGGTNATGKSRIAIYSGAGDVFNVDPAWNATVNGLAETLPSGTITYEIYPLPPPSTTYPAPADMTKILGTAVSTPATAGILDVNAKNINNVATTSVTTISANQGTTQPINFTGTAGSALVKGDAIDLAGQAITAAAGVTFPSSVASPTNITAGTITTVTNLTNAPTAGDLTAVMKASVTTAATAATPVAAAVTGNVGGNVAGSVGSVAGSVAGNVAGSVGSVTANVNADVKKINGTTVNGTGVSGDLWRG